MNLRGSNYVHYTVLIQPHLNLLELSLSTRDTESGLNVHWETVFLFELRKKLAQRLADCIFGRWEHIDRLLRWANDAKFKEALASPEMGG